VTTSSQPTTSLPAGEPITISLAAKVIPDGWTYVTNNELYPDPEFYTSTGLKFNFVNIGLESPAFEGSYAFIRIKGVGNLNEKTQGLSSRLGLFVGGPDTTALDTMIYDNVKTGTAFDYTFSISSPLIQFGIFMTGNVGFNLGLSELILFNDGQNPTSSSATTSQTTSSSTPSSSQPTTSLTAGSTLTFSLASKVIPQGWRYVTNNPQFPNPEFYAATGLKLNFVNMGLESPVFEGSYAFIRIKGVGNLNEKTQGLSSRLGLFVNGFEGTLLDTMIYNDVKNGSAYDYTFVISSPINQFGIYMTGNVGFNLGLTEIILSN
jgi:hypothetical protein